jgi:hypothetical protein
MTFSAHTQTSLLSLKYSLPYTDLLSKIPSVKGPQNELESFVDLLIPGPYQGIREILIH